jgi:hypothetical protein
MHLDLTDEETAALTKELADITGNDRYPFSPRIQTLRAILAKLRPEPAREPGRRRKCTRLREQRPPEGAEMAANTTRSAWRMGSRFTAASDAD